MAVKHFCDKCGKETTDDLYRRVKLEWKKEKQASNKIGTNYPWLEIAKYLLFCQTCFDDWLNLIGTFLNERFD